MRRVSAGYTIVEVIIFLAISAILFASAMKLIDGRETETTFNQVMSNAQSQIQSWINTVPSGFSGADPNQSNCKINAGRPTISIGAPSATPYCVFLGKAIQFVGTDTAPSASNTDTIYAYSIFGCLQTDCNAEGTGTGTLPTNLTSATPTPAVSGGATDLTQTFNLEPAKVIKVTSSAIDSNGMASSFTDSHLVGFFNSLNTEQSTTNNGALDLNVYQFRFDGSSPTPGDQTGGGALVDCLELISNTCKPTGSPDQWPEKLQSLQVCMSDGHQTALLTITSSYGVGASVGVKYVGANCS